MAGTLHLADDWAAALNRAAEAARVLVIGPTDAGKSRFAAALGAAGSHKLIDLDPGQKMVGPPGTVSLGCWRAGRFVLDHFHFIGSTSAAEIGGIARAGAALAHEPPFVANMAGFIHGPGIRLHEAVIDALEPDLIVTIGDAASLDPLLAGRDVLRLSVSPQARRKPPAERAAHRREAFAEALAGAEMHELPGLLFEPAPPAPFPAAGPERPVCALADDAGGDMALGILVSPGRIYAPLPARRPCLIRLGRMWALPAGEGWTLAEPLSPAWLHQELEG